MLNKGSGMLTHGASSPCISVILPVYNGEKYLVEAIKSILAQTFRDYELIIINDGSTDGSLDILQVYEKLDTRIRLISRENRNLATTLNESIDLARGKWIARMDQDDIALPHRFERQLQWLEHTQADICGSWVRRFGTSDKRVVRLHQSDEAIKIQMLFANPFAHPSVMMRTELAKQLRYDKLWEQAEDYDLWERAAEAGWKMTNVPEVLLLYRLHGTQISTATERMHQLRQKIRRRYWLSVIQSMQLDSACIDEVLAVEEPNSSIQNMDIVEKALTELLLQTDGEARDVMFSHAMRLYLRLAADCPDITLRWRRLNQKVGTYSTFHSLVELWFFHHMKIRPESRGFEFVKKVYIFLKQRT